MGLVHEMVPFAKSAHVGTMRSSPISMSLTGQGEVRTEFCDDEQKANPVVFITHLCAAYTALEIEWLWRVPCASKQLRGLPMMDSAKPDPSELSGSVGVMAHRLKPRVASSGLCVDTKNC